ncbi:hypothetical protein [Robertmurraya korlensis]|uniref:hypothetical protein n=1 Tax=Robertmurraya korlensis TaxID=519977 RepID=UPI00082603BA|nr:hypothetical protein [Robertmurraya korlensis]
MLGTIVTPGNVHDNHMLQLLVEKIIEKVKKPLGVAADAAFKTPAITNLSFLTHVQKQKMGSDIEQSKYSSYT